ncbi:hypothetical protein [Photobacterium atrarenae]|uniref:Flavodoxin n=1 Tax=Photobacterium atrarenae TaxID=865757 RepID=A0ABY5GN70_9GAMM|nr:hypothetical protein [Photobacterium atrarenae]UTV30144.1 hypothetical protein NNL38_16290 [Photobacterium atrarenae]
MQSQIEQLITSKNHWMASHITEAEFPTPQSQEGLALYQDRQAAGSYQLVKETDNTPAPQLSVYPVDCHPLTIRFALIIASQWPDEQEKETVIEYLTQIMLEEDSPAQLFVGFYRGKPTAAGMMFNGEADQSELTLISDVCALAGPNDQAFVAEMTHYLINQTQSAQRQAVVHIS